MKIALCQLKIRWEAKEENQKRAEAFAKEAKEDGAHMLFFPEMSFTGFSMNTKVTAEKNQETVKVMQEMAIRQNLALGFGWVEAAGVKARNHYTVVDENGAVLLDYVKLHPFHYGGEDQFFEAGRELKTFIYRGVRMGILICYDLRFPEPFQVLAETCEVLIVAANWPGARREHWKCLLQARAIENQVYVGGVNCIGDQQGLIYAGDSCLIGPEGQRINGFLEKEGLLTAEILPSVPKIRERFPVRGDRRWGLYETWYHPFTKADNG